MTAMVSLLATPFEKTFSGFVGHDDITRIKTSLFEQYHMTLPSSIKDFHKFENVTEQILGVDGAPIIKKAFAQICSLESESDHTIEIKDEHLKTAILHSYDDPVKKQILDIAFDYPLTLWEIAARTKIESGLLSENMSYLISHGLLSTSDLQDSEHNKKYYSTIDEMSVKIQGSEFHMLVTINDIAESDSLKIIS